MEPALLSSIHRDRIGRRNAILSNLIYGNGALGIDLGGDGVTPNHTGGLITGPNGFENYPVLSSAVSSTTQTTISGSLKPSRNHVHDTVLLQRIG